MTEPSVPPTSAAATANDAQLPAEAGAWPAGQPHPDELLSTTAKAPRWPLVAAAAVAASCLLVWFVPRNQDLAELHARVTSPTRALEASVAAGDRSTATLTALARERMRSGNAAGALIAVHDALDQNPKDPAALQALADLYDQLGRKSDSLATLERLQRLEPTASRQRVLVDRYLAAGQDRVAVQALRTLIQTFKAGTADDHLLLADKLVLGQTPKGAVEVLDAFERSQPQSMTAAVVASQVTALVASAQIDADKTAKARHIDQAVARARSWLKAHPESMDNDASLLIAPLVRAGLDDRASSVLEPLLDPKRAGMLSLWAGTMKRLGRADEALRRLASLDGSVKGNELLHQRVDLAIHINKLDIAMQALRSHGFARAPKADLVAITQAALTPLDVQRPSEQVRLGVLRELWTQGAQASLVAADSLLATRVALAVGDHVMAARLADRAAELCDAKAECAIQLAVINHQQGRSKEALAALALADTSGDIPETLLGEYARVSMALSHGREALAKVNKQRRVPSSQPFNEAWLLLSTAAGNHDGVAKWLKASEANEVSDAVTRDIFRMAVNSKAHGLTATAGQRIAANLKPAERVMLAQALMALGRTSESLAQWRELRTQTSAYNEAHLAALTLAVKRGVGGQAENELAELYAIALKDMPAGSKRDDMVQQLLDMGAHAKALPTLEQMAVADPKRWLATLDTAATKAGKREVLLPVWRKVVTAESLPVPLRTQVAVQLFEAGDKATADSMLRMFLVDAVPDDVNVQRLFTHWGQRWTPDQLDWAEARALTVRATDGVDAASLRGAWMRKLNEVGGSPRTVAVYRRLQSKPTQGPVFDAYIEALTKTGDRAALAAALRSNPMRVSN